MLAVVELNVLPVLAFGAVVLSALRMNGWLSDELVADLQKPFSRATLSAVAILATLVGQIYWIAARF